jgi:tight adherence protein B
MIWMITGITFVAATVIVLSIWVAAQGPSTQEVVRGRIGKLQASEKWAGIATDLKLVRDEMFSSIPILHRMLSRAPGTTWAQKFMAQAGMKTKPAKLFLVSCLVGMLTYVIVGHFLPFYIAVLAGGATFFIPLGVVAEKRRKRLNAFEERFPDALDMMGRAVRAGHAFTSAMELVVEDCDEPVSGEFAITFEEQNYGIPVRDALLHLADRVPSFDVRFLVTALIVQRDSGGNLAEVLDQLSRVIRERFRIRRDVKTKTALGRLTAGILIALPIAMLAMMMFVNPEYESIIFTDPKGPMILGIAAFMQVLGAFFLWRIVSIEV